jgi:hypothetical protein
MADKISPRFNQGVPGETRGPKAEAILIPGQDPRGKPLPPGPLRDATPQSVAKGTVQPHLLQPQPKHTDMAARSGPHLLRGEGLSKRRCRAECPRQPGRERGRPLAAQCRATPRWTEVPCRGCGNRRRASGSNSCKARNFCASPESLDRVAIVTFRGPNQAVDASDTTSPPLSARATPLRLRGSQKRWVQLLPDPDSRG